MVESELYRVDAYRADVVRGRAEAEKGANISYFALKALIGLPPDKDFEPADKTLAFKPEELDRPEAYISKALAERPEFKQLEQGLAAQKSLVEATTRRQIPVLLCGPGGVRCAGRPDGRRSTTPISRTISTMPRAAS